LDLVEKDSALEEFLVLLGALRYCEIHRSRAQGDGAGISFLDDAKEEDTVSSVHLESQAGPPSEIINTEQFARGADLCTDTSLYPSDCTPGGLSSLSEG
jgi:hypothetical protein